MTTNLLVTLKIQSGRAAEFDAMFEREFIRRSRTETGCLDYRLLSDRNDPHEKVIFERWASRSDLDVHLAQPWFAEHGPVMESFLAVPLTIRFLDDLG